jgi:cellulose synthase/poly-beta-1,6-N-acetylglucosamine synthase-like glycosyltransferase
VAAPGWLRGLASRWRDETCGAFAGEVVAHEPRGLVERFLGQRRMDHKGTLAHPYLPFATTANVAYRRAVLGRVGAFNPGLRSGGDVDLSWRMQKVTGLAIAYCPEAVVAHRNRSTVRGLYRQYRTYGEAFADLELLHDDFYSRFSHRYGLPRARAAVRFVRRHALSKPPQWMRPSTGREGLAMWALDALVKIAFDRGIRRGRRSASLTAAACRSAGAGSGSRRGAPERS